MNSNLKKHFKKSHFLSQKLIFPCLKKKKIFKKWIFFFLLSFTWTFRTSGTWNIQFEATAFHTRREFYGKIVVIWFSTGALGIFATLVYVFTMRVVIYDIMSIAIIPTLSTSILLCNLCYILLWISQRRVVKIAIRI